MKGRNSTARIKKWLALSLIAGWIFYVHATGALSLPKSESLTHDEKRNEKIKSNFGKHCEAGNSEGNSIAMEPISFFLLLRF
jgi:hypothetical protein